MKQLKEITVALSVLLIAGLCGMVNIVYAGPVEGQDYKVLANPQPTRNKAQIEVIEFFWYGCPHCNNLHLPLKSWLKSKPDDVDFRYVPAIFRGNWEPGAKIYYTLETMGGMDDLHDKIYDAIHRDKINLNDEATLFGWLEKQGVDRDKFVKIYHSFTMQNQIARSKQMMQQYQLSGVPILVVEGKYLVSGKPGGAPQDTVATLEKVIDMARKARQ
jgi:thiol:disulfide interchange protein DsbA